MQRRRLLAGTAFMGLLSLAHSARAADAYPSKLINIVVPQAPGGANDVIGRVLAKTSLAFMIVAALEIVSTYAGPPPRFARLVDIAFISSRSARE